VKQLRLALRSALLLGDRVGGFHWAPRNGNQCLAPPRASATEYLPDSGAVALGLVLRRADYMYARQKKRCANEV
jgi:hypothetical protein